MNPVARLSTDRFFVFCDVHLGQERDSQRRHTGGKHEARIAGGLSFLRDRKIVYERAPRTIPYHTISQLFCWCVFLKDQFLCDVTSCQVHLSSFIQQVPRLRSWKITLGWRPQCTPHRHQWVIPLVDLIAEYIATAPLLLFRFSRKIRRTTGVSFSFFFEHRVTVTGAAHVVEFTVRTPSRHRLLARWARGRGAGTQYDHGCRPAAREEGT